MAQVPSWELRWVSLDSAVPGSSLKAYRWVKTDKVQQFSDDEGEADDPLAPLPDEPDAADAEEDDQDDDQLKLNSQVESRELSEAPPRSRPAESIGTTDTTFKPHPLANSLTPGLDDAEDSEHVVSAPEMTLDPLGPSEAPHLEPLNEVDLGILDLPGLADPRPSSFDIQDGLNVVDADTVMKTIDNDI